MAKDKAELRVSIDKPLLKRVQVLANILEMSQAELISILISDCMPEKFKDYYERYNLSDLNGD
jgi:hypothetical protein